jgi:hypothetical protein
MRIRRFIVGSIAAIASVVVLPGGLPAAAETTFEGVCVGTVQMTFANDIKLLSGPTNLTNLTGNATCVTNADTPPKTLGLTGSGTGVVTQCGAILVNGAFNAAFVPSPAPPPSNGAFTYLGTTSGGTLRLAGANPTLHAVGVLAGTGAIACAQSGASTFTFQMVLPFADP